jgi:hypothetical protein
MGYRRGHSEVLPILGQNKTAVHDGLPSRDSEKIDFEFLQKPFE